MLRKVRVIQILSVAIAVIISLLLVGCGNSDITPIYSLPDKTTSGQNTVGFRVNGRTWVPDVESGYSPDFEVVYDKGSGSIVMQAHNTVLNEYFRIELRDSIYRPVTIDLSYVADTNEVTFLTDWVSYQNDTSNVGTFTISRLDTNNNIISGTFELTVSNSRQDEDLVITSGRFDATY